MMENDNLYDPLEPQTETSVQLRGWNRTTPCIHILLKALGWKTWLCELAGSKNHLSEWKCYLSKIAETKPFWIFWPKKNSQVLKSTKMFLLCERRDSCGLGMAQKYEKAETANIFIVRKCKNMWQKVQLLIGSERFNSQICIHVPQHLCAQKSSIAYDFGKHLLKARTGEEKKNRVRFKSCQQAVKPSSPSSPLVSKHLL